MLRAQISFLMTHEVFYRGIIKLIYDFIIARMKHLVYIPQTFQSQILLFVLYLPLNEKICTCFSAKFIFSLIRCLIWTFN